SLRRIRRGDEVDVTLLVDVEDLAVAQLGRAEGADALATAIAQLQPPRAFPFRGPEEGVATQDPPRNGLVDVQPCRVLLGEQESRLAAIGIHQIGSASCRGR